MTAKLMPEQVAARSAYGTIPRWRWIHRSVRRRRIRKMEDRLGVGRRLKL